MNNAEQNAILDVYLDLKGFLESDDEFALAMLRESAEESITNIEKQFSFLLES